MALIDDVKKVLRVTVNNFDTEITDLIDAAKADLELSGVLAAKITDGDKLIKRALMTYVKAHFGYDNPDADKLKSAYDMLKAHLTLSAEYTEAGS